MSYVAAAAHANAAYIQIKNLANRLKLVVNEPTPEKIGIWIAQEQIRKPKFLGHCQRFWSLMQQYRKTYTMAERNHEITGKQRDSSLSRSLVDVLLEQRATLVYPLAMSLDLHDALRSTTGVNVQFVLSVGLCSLQDQRNVIPDSVSRASLSQTLSLTREIRPWVFLVLHCRDKRLHQRISSRICDFHEVLVKLRNPSMTSSNGMLPWTSGNQTLEVLRESLFLGLRLFSDEVFVGRTLHIYNVLRQRIKLPPISFMQDLLSTFKRQFFPKGIPLTDFVGNYYSSSTGFSVGSANGRKGQACGTCAAALKNRNTLDVQTGLLMSTNKWRFEPLLEGFLPNLVSQKTTRPLPYTRLNYFRVYLVCLRIYDQMKAYKGMMGHDCECRWLQYLLSNGNEDELRDIGKIMQDGFATFGSTKVESFIWTSIGPTQS